MTSPRPNGWVSLVVGHLVSPAGNPSPSPPPDVAWPSSAEIPIDLIADTPTEPQPWTAARPLDPHEQGAIVDATMIRAHLPRTCSAPVGASGTVSAGQRRPSQPPPALSAPAIESAEPIEVAESATETAQVATEPSELLAAPCVQSRWTTRWSCRIAGPGADGQPAPAKKPTGRRQHLILIRMNSGCAVPLLRRGTSRAREDDELESVVKRLRGTLHDAAATARTQ